MGLSFLIVKQGVPYQEDTTIPLEKSCVVIGRTTDSAEDTDIAFSSIFVSRKHFAIHEENGQYYIEDLDSKNGTYVNHNRLQPNEKTLLQHTDHISLAHGHVLLTFSTYNLNDTIDIVPFLKAANAMLVTDLSLDPIKQELSVHDECFAFSEKEYKCIELLVQNQRQFVSKDEIKTYVWPERSPSIDEIPDVSSEEVNALIYRIRQKTQQVLAIENIRSKGYILSLKESAANRL
ncbi:FHA domain-containing protein [Paenibacillus selenitireducens]|jgi:pSer/pThr/pTyr-binding forkhead associated (FHA) protein|nr:FHA domain-containing protein [Paenibacillus selenitireducens]